ncbi:MAG: GNAT family N-acetyltransferase [archaeon]
MNKNIDIIKKIPASNLREAYKISNEYLDKESFEEFKKRYGLLPKLFIGYYRNGKIIGICHAKLDKDYGLILQGIAINFHLKAKGLGTKLLKFFEQQAKKCGFNYISLGSADGYVEHFYLKNNYNPSSLRINISKNKLPNNYKKLYYIQKEKNLKGNKIAIYFDISKYFIEKDIENLTTFKARIKKEFKIKNACYIFEKTIGN